MQSVTIHLPGIKAVSRNDTTGHYIKYRDQLIIAENWMWIFGKKHEYHFDKRVDITIVAYYDNRGKKQCADPSNVDDKIFVDTLVRWKRQGGSKKKKELGLSKSIERKVWFIEDDDHKHIRYVIKEAIPSDKYEVYITITEVEE